MMHTHKTELMFTRPVLKGFLWLGLFVLQSSSLGTVQITAKVGATATLPCNYQMQHPLTSYRIYWQKYVAESTSDLVVIAYSQGQEISTKDILFRNRTKMDEKNLTVWISSVKVSDKGTYKCVIILKEQHLRDEHVNLIVEADFSQPIIDVDIPPNACGTNQTQVTLICSSHGGYPQPKMTGFINNKTEQWNYTFISDNQTELFSITGSLVYSISQNTLVHCSVEHPGFQVSTNYNLSIPKCPEETSPSPHMITVASIVILIFLVAVIVLITFLRCRKQTMSHQPVATVEMAPQKFSNGTSEALSA